MNEDAKREQFKQDIYKNRYGTRQRPFPKDPVIRAYVDTVLENGYCIIRNAFTEQDALNTIREIDRLHGPQPKASNDYFGGLKTNRILSPLGKTRAFDKYCLIPEVMALNEFFLDEDFLIYVMQSITIQPGEKAQLLHHDDSSTRLPRPRHPVTAATMICLDDYTELNGATRIVPGSHKWGDDRIAEDHEAISAVCPRGSVIYFLGTTWHSGGANKSNKPRYAATIQYCQPWVRPLENLMISIDPRRALPGGDIPERIADMMGYKSAIPFIGYADGLNPRKASSRMLRWLKDPINYNPPVFASEDGKKEKHSISGGSKL